LQTPKTLECLLINHAPIIFYLRTNANSSLPFIVPRKPLYLKRFFIDNTHMLRYYRRSVYKGFKGFHRY